MPERLPNEGFRERLQSACKEKGIVNNNQFAVALGKTASTTENWWRGLYPTYSSDFLTICDFTMKTADYLLFGKDSAKEYNVRIEICEQDRETIEATEGEFFIEKLVPIPIAKDPISAGSPREVREDPDGVAVVYREWAKNPQNFTVVRVKGESMHPTIPDGSLVGIDHSRKDPRKLNGKVVAIRKDGEATIKRLMIVSDDLSLGMTDNPAEKDKTIALQGEEINSAIVGKVAWWWGKQK